MGSSEQIKINNKLEKRLFAYSFGILLGFVIIVFILFFYDFNLLVDKDNISDNNEIQELNNQVENDHNDLYKTDLVSDEIISNNTAKEFSTDETNMEMESSELYEEAKKMKNGVSKSNKLKEVEEICTTIIDSNNSNLLVYKRRMFTYIELAKLSKEDENSILYYEAAKQDAYTAIKIAVYEKEKRTLQYYYAQCLYEIARINRDESRYGESLSYFMDLTDYEPYSKYYIIIIQRSLYELTGDIKYLYDSVDQNLVYTSEGLDEREYYSYIKELSDIYFLLGQHYYKVDDNKSKDYFNHSVNCIKKAQLIKYSDYLDRQLSIIDSYVAKGGE